ncbi:MAG: tetratricopeptide repeat protein [Nitrospinaceae bacterium]
MLILSGWVRIVSYDTAVRKQPNYAIGHFNLGVAYQKLGKRQKAIARYKEAFRLFRLAAEQGYANAQYNLGLKYAEGQGVPQDYVSAHMWFNLSGSNGDKDAVEKRNIVEKKMTKDQISEAQRLARNWKPKK